MDNYEKRLEENEKRNQKFIEEFEFWLNEKGLVKKTIRKHLSNIDLYLNGYLTYMDINKMEDGINEFDSFLGDWFIRKCMWSSKSSIKENATSIKKFYQCMKEKGYVKEEDYSSLCEEIKENMECWLEFMNDYDSGEFYSFI